MLCVCVQDLDPLLALLMTTHAQQECAQAMWPLRWFDLSADVLGVSSPVVAPKGLGHPFASPSLTPLGVREGVSTVSPTVGREGLEAGFAGLAPTLAGVESIGHDGRLMRSSESRGVKVRACKAKWAVSKLRAGWAVVERTVPVCVCARPGSVPLCRKNTKDSTQPMPLPGL